MGTQLTQFLVEKCDSLNPSSGNIIKTDQGHSSCTISTRKITVGKFSQLINKMDKCIIKKNRNFKVVYQQTTSDIF